MSELNNSVVIMRENMLISGEIYPTGKNFTLPPAVTAVTNITSGPNMPNMVFGALLHTFLYLTNFEQCLGNP